VLADGSGVVDIVDQFLTSGVGDEQIARVNEVLRKLSPHVKGVAARRHPSGAKANRRWPASLGIPRSGLDGDRRGTIMLQDPTQPLEGHPIALGPPTAVVPRILAVDVRDAGLRMRVLSLTVRWLGLYSAVLTTHD
jgi:hypothetical protein